ncbi:PASTA domain-containing protein [Flavobacterium jejuense]|uniref:PASTA domain-containing protein n=1 Tax=Flavobacterium jejuense TaxID=1544455 RepID=A0ABX0IKG9_9FLAO|nr:PASTA domain-containing protein [Flavobacterium jejuense]NHN24322.1 PASTA domain-containing protein [Flavobacterium jejuense]
MSIRKFLTSKTFLIQLAIAFGIIVVLGFALLKFLDVKTNHGEEIPVPDLSKMQVVIADEKLKELGLELLLLDTVDFRKDMPPYSIVEQSPKFGTTVKNGRKIYVKVNSGGYTDVILPDFKEKTYRQISANLKSMGLKEGRITYKKNMAKDVVLSLTQNGKTLKEGDKVKKNSVVDFVLGDGKEVFDQSDMILESEEEQLPDEFR